MSEPESLEGEIRILQIRIKCQIRERDELRARLQRRSAWAKIFDAALSVSIEPLWLVGSLSALILVMYAVTVTQMYRLGPG